jgi:hypothetical protein
MVKLLEGATEKYTEGGSMTALGRCGGSQSVGSLCVVSGLLVLLQAKLRGSRSAVKLGDEISHQ